MQVIQTPRTQDINYGQLGQLVGQGINPQGNMYQKLMPLLMVEQLKGQIARKQSDSVLDRLEGKGVTDYNITFGPGGTVKSFKKLRPKQQLEDVEARGVLERHRTPIRKSEEFQEGRGLPAFLSQSKARITPRTRNLINQIKTQADMDEFFERIDEARADGIDVDAVLEYFGKI